MRDVISTTKKYPKTKEVIAKTEWCIRFGMTNKAYPSFAPPKESTTIQAMRLQTVKRFEA